MNLISGTCDDGALFDGRSGPFYWGMRFNERSRWMLAVVVGRLGAIPRRAEEDKPKEALYPDRGFPMSDMLRLKHRRV